MHCLPKKASTNSADPDQTASEEAVRSGSSVFAVLIIFQASELSYESSYSLSV